MGQPKDIPGNGCKWWLMRQKVLRTAHMSPYIFMHLCIYARAWQLSWPWLDLDKGSTSSSCWPESVLNGHLASWLSVEGADKTEMKEGNKGGLKKQIKNQRGNKKRSMQDVTHLMLMLFPHSRCSFIYALNLTAQSGVKCFFMKWNQSRGYSYKTQKYIICDHVCVHLTEKKKTWETKIQGSSESLCWHAFSSSVFLKTILKNSMKYFIIAAKSKPITTRKQDGWWNMIEVKEQGQESRRKRRGEKWEEAWKAEEVQSSKKLGN